MFPLAIVFVCLGMFLLGMFSALTRQYSLRHVPKWYIRFIFTVAGLVSAFGVYLLYILR